MVWRLISTEFGTGGAIKTFYSRVRDIQRKNNSLLCIGLDTDPAKIPGFLSRYADPAYEFNRRIIDATADLVCAYKINMAFYESAAGKGWRTIHRTLARIPDGIITICDGKRGDIGNSAEQYARLIIEDYGFASCTVNPYMGKDSVEPFMRHSRHGVFILAITSNPGAKDFQHLRVGGRPLFERVIDRAKRWNTQQNLGLVAGATRPRDLQRVRALVPDMPLLIPGVGAQGGDVELAVRYGCTRDGMMALINASRSIIYASAGRDFSKAARVAALRLCETINSAREKYV